MEAQSEHSQAIGRLLTDAREALSLTQKDIATRLNLNEQIIVALDAGDLSSLPAPAYVRGYIRHYARIVNLDADELINTYENMACAAPEILPDVKPESLHQVSSTDSLVQTITYVVTFTLLVLFIIWWRGQYIVNTDLPVKEDNAGNPDAGALTHTQDVILDLPTETLSNNHEGINANNIVATDPEKSTSLLEIELTDESWIEVHDALGKELYRDLARSREKISLTGYSPLLVKLGNAQAVSVYFNGEFFDTKNHREANIARFLLE